jgi:hypothetical protein
VGTAFPRAQAIKVVQQAFNAGDTIFTPTVSSSLAKVKAYGARRSSGYGLLLVNIDQDNAATTAITIGNDTRAFTASSLLYGKAQYDESRNGAWVAPSAQAFGKVVGSFSVVLPPWSITAITLAATP